VVQDLLLEVEVARRRMGLPRHPVVASQTWVRCPSTRSSGAPAPPIRVGTQPGSTAWASVAGRILASAIVRVVTQSLLAE
jgi:hypothetical protein